MSADEILRLRRRLGISQEKLAKALGVAGRLVVYRWEAGAREPAEPIRRLFAWLGDIPPGQAQAFLDRLESYEKKSK